MRNRSLVFLFLLSIGASACNGTAEPPTPADAAPGPEETSAPDVSVPDVPSLDAADACGPLVLSRVPSDFVFLVDTSASWTTRADRFEGARDAVLDVIANPAFASSGRAAMLWPRLVAGATACASSSYANLDVDWPSPAASFTAALSAVSFAGESALGPALGGAIELARARFDRGPQRTVSIVLVTDATPMSDEACTSWDGVADVAASGFVSGRGKSVHTHVVSVLGRAVAPDHAGRIGAIVTAGAGFAAYVNGSREDVRNSTRTALANIVDRMNACTFALPNGVVPSELTLEVPGFAKETVTRAASAATCAGSAFYLDDETAPTTLTLCSGEAGIGGLCERTFLQARSGGPPKVTIETTCGG